MSNQANIIDKLVSQLKELEVLGADLKSVFETIHPEDLNSQLMSISTDINKFSFMGLIDELNSLSHQLVDKAENVDHKIDTNNTISKLQQELIERDQWIRELELSQSNYVVANSNIMRENQLLKESSSHLQNKISELRMHTKDQSLKLETTSQNLIKCETELKSQTRELNELCNGNYKYKKLIADYEDQLENQKRQLEKLSITKAKGDHLVTRLKKETEYLDESYETLKQTFGNLEKRESSLKATIEELQQEKSHLQSRLERLLTGVSKNITHNPASTVPTNNSDINADKMLPYLPFCFPERLPAAIRFKREISTNVPTVFSKRSALTIKTFPSNSFIRIEHAAPRMHAPKVVFNSPKPKIFQFSIEKSQPALQLKNFACQLAPIKFIPVFRNSDTQVKNIKRAFKHTYFLPAPFFDTQSQLELPPNTNFGIFTYSIDLLLSYLSRGIFEKHYFNLNYDTDWIITNTEDNYKKIPLKFTNFFIEKLAFRHRILLKSHPMYIARKNIFRSKKTNKLKTVLETFGNTISSMVRKYNLSSDQLKDDNKE